MEGLAKRNYPTDEYMLADSLDKVDKYINKNYLANLLEFEAIELPESERKTNAIRLFLVDKIVLDKKQNANDKLLSVYSAVQSVGATLVILIRGTADGAKLYFGISSVDQVATAEKTLNKSFKANFPGSNLSRLNNTGISQILNDAVFEGEKCNVSSVTVVPAVRDEDKEKFVQGIEKLVDTMRGEEYSAFFIARPVSKEELSSRKRGLENLYSALSPFQKSTLAFGENESDSISKGISTNFSHTVNDSISTTLGTNSSTNISKTKGTSLGFSLGLSYGSNESTTQGISSGSSYSKSTTSGSSDTAGTGTSLTDSRTTGTSQTVTIESVDKAVSTILEKIDDQLKRIKACESYGLWESAAYFVAEEIQTSIVAANTYKALVSGDQSDVENSYINVWNLHNPNAPKLIDHIHYCRHPAFAIPSQDEQTGPIITPANYVSGKELPLFMGLPQRSVSGVSVTTMAEFGRNVYSEDGVKAAVSGETLPLGSVYHMGAVDEGNIVNLDLNSFTSHCFIAGSTGSGKSNTTSVLLGALITKNIPFLVIEPAKGEYKQEFGSLPGIHIFSTNPRYGQMLRLNPFWFDAENIHVLEHLDRLIEIFNACWEMYAAMPAILKAAAEQIYIRKGWDILNSVYLGEGKPKFPTFADMLAVLPEIIKSSSYSTDTQGDYTGALVTRVASLANGISGQIFCADMAIDDSVLFDENTIVDLSRVGSSETKSLIMGLLVMKLTEYRTAQAIGSNSKLRHITVIEEAHNLLKRTSTAQGQESANLIGKSVEMISNSIAEMRTYGEGFIIVDQSPTAVDISAIKNTNTKIIMRLPEKSDCEAVGNAMALGEDQVKELAKLPTGVAAVIQNNWLEAVLVKIYRATENYRGSMDPIDTTVLRELRGVIATQVVRQYFDARRFDVTAIEKAVEGVNAPPYKKQEALRSAKVLVAELNGQRDVKLVAQWLLNFSCCQSAFDIHENRLRFVNFETCTEEDYNELESWRDDLERSVLSVVGIDPSISQFFVRNLIYAQTLKSNDSQYRAVYEMLYEKHQVKENVEVAKDISAIETPDQKVL